MADAGRRRVCSHRVNPRGSSGRGRDFSHAIWANWGNKDFDEVMAAVDHMIALGVADPNHLGVGGWSYGGILTNYVITTTTRFKGAISGASEVNYAANSEGSISTLYRVVRQVREGNRLCDDGSVAVLAGYNALERVERKSKVSLCSRAAWDEISSAVRLCAW